MSKDPPQLVVLGSPLKLRIMFCIIGGLLGDYHFPPLNGHPCKTFTSVYISGRGGVAGGIDVTEKGAWLRGGKKKMELKKDGQPTSQTRKDSATHSQWTTFYFYFL